MKQQSDQVFQSPAQVDQQRLISEEIVVAAPCDEVWRAWTTTAGIESFFSQDAAVELRVGGKFEVYFSREAPTGSRGSEGCKVLAFLPQRMLTFSWNAPPKFPNVRKQHTQVVLLLDSLAPDRTRVRLTQHGWGTGAEWDQVFEYFSKAWPRVLANLKAALETRQGSASTANPKEWICILRLVRPTFEQDATEQENATVAEHFQQLVRLHREQRLILAGRSLDSLPVGIVVFQADNEEAAREIMNNDAAVKAGIFKAELRPYRVALLRGL